MTDLPTTIGRYRIVRRIGAGGMGEVFLAEDPTIGRQLAVKTIRMQGASTDAREAGQRLLREARAAGRLHHPGVVTLFDAGEAEQVLFLAFEFVDGPDLSRRMKTPPPFTLREVVTLVRQVADALAFAHDQGIVHRDIKPSNVLLAPGGQAKVADFGLAKMSDESIQLTQTGSVVGSPQYMSPEQVRGERLDGRSDIFSLGVILYEMLTAMRPFGGQTISTLVYEILSKEPPDVSQLRPGSNPRLVQLVRRMLTKDLASRIATAHEVASELDAVLAETPAEQLDSPAVAMVNAEAPTELMASTPNPAVASASHGSLPSSTPIPSSIDPTAALSQPAGGVPSGIPRPPGMTQPTAPMSQPVGGAAAIPPPPPPPGHAVPPPPPSNPGPPPSSASQPVDPNPSAGWQTVGDPSGTAAPQAASGGGKGRMWLWALVALVGLGSVAVVAVAGLWFFFGRGDDSRAVAETAANETVAEQSAADPSAADPSAVDPPAVDPPASDPSTGEPATEPTATGSTTTTPPVSTPPASAAPGASQSPPDRQPTPSPPSAAGGTSQPPPATGRAASVPPRPTGPDPGAAASQRPPSPRAQPPARPPAEARPGGAGGDAVADRAPAPPPTGLAPELRRFDQRASRAAQEVSSSRRLRFQIDPPEAYVRVWQRGERRGWLLGQAKDYDASEKDSKIAELPVDGDYLLTLVADGLPEVDVLVRASASRGANATLIRADLASGGGQSVLRVSQSLAFDGTPVDATVFVDGREMGPASQWPGGLRPGGRRSLQLDPGSHTIRLEAPGYQPHTFEVLVTPNADRRSQKVQYRLEP